MIPTQPEQMTERWIEKQLRAPEGSLENMAFAPVGTGQMCDSFRLTLQWNGHDGPASIIAKCPSQDEASRHIAKLVRNYELEVSWYRDLSAETPVNCPHCYHAEIDENGVDFALLLDDRAPASQGDQLSGADLQSCKAAISEMANLHAAHWNSESLQQYEWLAYGAANKELVRNMLPALYGGFSERYADRLDQDILQMGTQLVANIDAYLDWKGTAQAIVHGDFRLDNLLFSANGNVCVVDWQTVGIGCPLADLAYFIGTSIADPQIRKAREKELFAHYLDRIAGTGVEINAERYWDDYRLYSFSGFIMAIFASMNVERTLRGDEMFAVMAERPARQALELDSLSLLA